VPTLSRPVQPSHRPAAFVVTLTTLCAVGCQTPNTANTVAPPATGMIGQPAQHGGWATPSQGAAYPPTVSAPPVPGMAAPAMPQPAAPMPGPATQWQSASPTAQPAANGWSWSQPTGTAQPSIQQYGQQLQNQAGQAQQSLTNQAQQYTNQLQAQTQQAVAGQQQQLNQQLQNAAGQYQQGLNNQLQSAQQQVTAQMPASQQTVTTTNTWNPFATNASSLPPARATPPTSLPKY